MHGNRMAKNSEDFAYKNNREQEERHEHHHIYSSKVTTTKPFDIAPSFKEEFGGMGHINTPSQITGGFGEHKEQEHQIPEQQAPPVLNQNLIMKKPSLTSHSKEADKDIDMEASYYPTNSNEKGLNIDINVFMEESQTMRSDIDIINEVTKKNKKPKKNKKNPKNHKMPIKLKI